MPTKVSNPENVDSESLEVFLDDMYEIPMSLVGYTNNSHEYKCSDDYRECHRSEICPEFRRIDCDKGNFQRLPKANIPKLKEAHDISKNIERPFNLLKNQTGLEDVRVRDVPRNILPIFFKKWYLLIFTVKVKI
jgi:hypothetical protein